MKRRVAVIGSLLFCSGMCALVYQVAWLRELRLIFGASTAASAAVLAMFMGGLGAGGILLGKRADAARSPLMLYANLELLVAGLAAATPIAVSIARSVYIALGGTIALGMTAGTVVRLLLAGVVLLPPTFVMGGTLPAAARAAETDDDLGRRNLASLYGINTLGAVTGAALSTFLLLEVFGTRLTLWMACLVNALIGVLARGISRMLVADEAPAAPAGARRAKDEAGEAAAERPAEGAAGEPSAAEPAAALARAGESAEAAAGAEAPAKPAAPAAATADGDGLVPPAFVLAAAAIAGFAFLLMELVWYRMLGPLLGGSSYTFGLILAIALFGVGLGGGAYALWMKDRPATIAGFAFTCAAEAVCMAVPLALGDRVAFLAAYLRPLGSLGFWGLVSGWAVVTTIVVVPAAFVSGIQFPLLIALLGRGHRDVGRHVGLAYAWNTAGAIAGSLAGGFGLLPLLTAPGAWRATILTLVVLGLAAMALSLRARRSFAPLVLPAAATVVGVLLVGARGPTGAWRHAAIGAGREDDALRSLGPNGQREWANMRRRSVRWEADGVESSVALNGANGYAFIVNGKADGHVKRDAGTQVMSGLIGTMLHPNPTKALVIGLGTGSTAGWVGAVPSMQRVDVVELEPAILRVARDCATVNANVLDNPKVHVFIGDAREVLLTTRERYDVVFSEPSNPYRAGISSLFTQDFYKAAAGRLAEGGIFLQWLQAYDVDATTVRSAYATLASVFPTIDTWLTESGDLVLLGSMQPMQIDADKLRARIAEEPYRSALAWAWRVTDLEGVLAHFIARTSLAEDIALQEGGAINTDDRNRLEFAFARNVGRHAALFDPRILREVVRARKEDRPDVRGVVDWDKVEERRIDMDVLMQTPPQMPPSPTPDQQKRAMALVKYARGDVAGGLKAWREQKREPETLMEIEAVAEALADQGEEAALPLAEKLRPLLAPEADAIVARLRLRQRKLPEAAQALVAAFERYRKEPFSDENMMLRALTTALDVGTADKELGRRLLEVVRTPFAASMLDEERHRLVMRLSMRIDQKGLCAQAIEAFEPYVPWRLSFLEPRLRCYEMTNHPNAAIARRELDEFLANEPPSFALGLVDLRRPASKEPPPPPQQALRPAPVEDPVLTVGGTEGVAPEPAPAASAAVAPAATAAPSAAPEAPSTAAVDSPATTAAPSASPKERPRKSKP